MSIIIPSQIIPNYTWPAQGLPVQPLKIGSAIKDLDNSDHTQMGKAHAIAVERAKIKFAEDLSQYDKDFQAASLKAKDAKRHIGYARRQKIRAITSLVVNILAVVGVAIVAAVTGTWPIAFVAAPFLVGIVPSSYYTDIFRKLNNELASDMTAPDRLEKPVLKLPFYNKDKDLELAQSRLNAQNALSIKSLPQVADSGWSNDEIVNYRLLDRVAVLKEEQHPAFYAKSIQLINAYRTIGQERTHLMNQASREYSLMASQLRNWKRKEDTSIDRQWSAIRMQERSQDRRIDRSIRHNRVPIIPVLGSIATAISRSELERQERAVSNTYYRIEAQTKSWHETARANINAAYNQSLVNIETQYAAIHDILP